MTARTQSTARWRRLCSRGAVASSVILFVVVALFDESNSHGVNAATKLPTASARAAREARASRSASGAQFWAGYLGAGYDIYFGNPKNSDSSVGVDPGYRQPIFNVSWVYEDQSPYGVSVGECSTQCSTLFMYSEGSGPNSFQSSSGKHFAVDLSQWPAYTTASADFAAVSQQTSVDHDVYIESTAQCCVHTAQIDFSVFPIFDLEFKFMVASMPIVYNETTADWFAMFLAKYGTHVLLNADFGAKFGRRSQFTATAYSLLSTSNLDLEEMATWSSTGFTAAAASMSSNALQKAAVFASFSKNQAQYISGAAFPADSSAASWSQSVADAVPVDNLNVQLISSFLTPYYFSMETDILAKADALQAAVTDYCKALLVVNKLSSCDGAGSDPPFPSTSTFGGMFTETDGCASGYFNPLTGSNSCPGGYSAYAISRSLEPEGKCGQVSYLCLLSTVDPQSAFGGVYQLADLDPANNRNNPMTGAPSCPAGYTSIPYGRVLTAEPNQWGASQYYCFNTDVVLGATEIGGFYQTVDLGHTDDVVDNFYTGAAACPAGYVAYMLSRQYAPEARVGASQFICLNNVFVVPPKSIFGGAFVKPDVCTGSYSDQYTGQQNCPYGFQMYGVGRSLQPEGRCGQITFLCLWPFTADGSLQNSFGGMYQTADNQPNNDIYNPVTGGLSCPSGFTSIQFGRVLTAEPFQWGANQFYCYNTAVPLGSTSFGGIFQAEDLGQTTDVVPNYFTGMATCPPGFLPYLISRQYAPEDNVGATQFVCLSDLSL
jgi:hypothetical protein